MRRAILGAGKVLLLFLSARASAAPDQPPTEPPVTATVETTLGTADGRIRQFAFDGDPSTFFVSAGGMDRASHFTIVFDQPVALRSVAVVTGRPDQFGRLDSGTLEGSPDGKTFEPLAQFADGAARAETGGRKIQAVRLQAGADQNHPVAIGEVSIVSDPPVATFAYPVEFIVDVSGAPEMKEWTEKVARLCERNYRMINEELKSDGFTPPRLVRLAIKKDYNGVAAASGDRIVGSFKFFQQHPDDVGAMIHETAHVVQHYRARNNPGWLVEGVADYVRFFKFEPGKLGRIDAEKAHYNSSYRVTAAFLAYVTEKYDPHLVLKLNELMRAGRYRNEVFQELTGKTLQELDDEWRATLPRGERRERSPSRKGNGAP